MSQENVEIVRRVYAAWNDGHLETWLQALDPDFELCLPEGGLNIGTRRGREAFRQFMEGFLEVWDDLRAEPERFFEAGEQVVVFVRIRGVGKGSGVEAETRPAHLVTLRAGNVARLVVFPERAKALEAVGLSEQDAHADS